jgi:hypothetical protein
LLRRYQYTLPKLALVVAGVACHRPAQLAPFQVCTLPNATPTHSALAWGPRAIDDTIADVLGRVVDAATGTPLDFANVQVEPGGRVFTTDSSGSFRVPNLPQGRYDIRVRHPRYDGVHDSITHAIGGLRLYAALARNRGMDQVCPAD